MHPVLEGIRLVTFDLDGTLIDSVPDLAVAVDRALDDHGVTGRGEGRVRDWVGNGSHKLLERALRDATGELPAPEVHESAHEAFLHYYGQAPNVKTRLYSGVREALDVLHGRGFALALVTNKPHAFIAPILEEFGLSAHFGLCLGGDSLPQKKPDPAPLRHVARHFGMDVQECLMVGDSRHDIDAGRRAGFRTLAVPYGYNHGEPVAASRPDAMVESLAELV
ncbi:phosphoglycolate phosphatase [Litchfieldella qijiaojingensis]|uniref:Phosphoglycolate phosphatase n=1 Tax=Litchfieldella qijiaojingensis TaxID=980347 RepID=A0ABQ2YYE7_9GAMM|nr:phosphoglycolate phosphatase [Halomonas qijiaojingensis]GGX96121.1 phosphoglycolate phosphatase [Halomonas qijiaojingensis]